MNGVHLKTIREWLGLPGDWLAQHLGVNPRTVRSWEQGRDTVPDYARLEVERLNQATNKAVERLVADLNSETSPVACTYQTDEQYRQHEPDKTWPAAWHRRVTARAAQEIPGLVVVEPED